MNNPILKRIKALETEIKVRNGGLFTVFYKDGTTEKVYPAAVIRLSLEEADKIDHFEEDEGGLNGGVLEGLANALLLSEDEDGGKEGET